MTLLATKFFSPTIGPDIIYRPHLQSRLEEGRQLGRALTLISAPAGYGKTTLTATWLQSVLDSPENQVVVGWLSLEESENDPKTFLAYFTNSIERMLPGAGRSLLPFLELPQLPPSNLLLIDLVNDLSQIQTQAILVLDDYHVINAPEINDIVRFLIEHLPNRFHLVLLTRHDPISLKLARLRVQGRITEIRVSDLRFSQSEIQQFIGKVLINPPDEIFLTNLESQSEGWIAAIQMAVIALKTNPDIEGTNQLFSSPLGNQRYLMDYLLEEVLEHLSPEIQDLLLYTSILERLCASLCEDLIAIPINSISPQVILEYLDQTNLFLIPLDNEHTWYRYHHLFASLMQARLTKRHRETIPHLHHRAAEWFERHALPGEAMEHALSSRDWKLAERIFLSFWREVSHANGPEVALKWLERLPIGYVRASAPLSVAYCWLLHVLGRYQTIGPHLNDASNAIKTFSTTSQTGGYQSDSCNTFLLDLESQIFLLRAILWRIEGKFDDALADIQLVLQMIPPGANLTRGITLLDAGHIYRGLGKLTLAAQTYQQALALLWQGNNFTAFASCSYALVETLLGMGRLHQADQVCQNSIHNYSTAGMNNSPAFGILQSAMASIAFVRNEVETADRILVQAIQLIERGGFVDILIQSYLVFSQVKSALGEQDNAHELLRSAQLNANQSASWILKQKTDWHEIRLLINENTPAARNRLNKAAKTIRYVPQQAEAALLEAEVLIQEGHPADALPVLQHGLDLYEQIEFEEGICAALFMHAKVYLLLGQKQLAIQAVERVLALTSSEGYLRIWVDYGANLLSLLPKCSSFENTRNFCARVSEANYQAINHQGGSRRQKLNVPGCAGLVEPLSGREIEVLHLMEAGLTYKEMADKLVVVMGTAKTHVHNIYAKLGARNRTEALAIARHHGLLPPQL